MSEEDLECQKCEREVIEIVENSGGMPYYLPCGHGVVSVGRTSNSKKKKAGSL